jgi:hypothetical protein
LASGATRGVARAAYRVRQVLIGLRPALRAGEVASVRTLLSEDERALFLGMHARDRRHSMDMLLWLRARMPASAGQPSTALEVATLLHDIGKGRLRLVERVAFVLLGALGEARRDRWCVEGGAFRGALWRLRHHARLGAARLDGVSTERVRWLVAHHSDALPPDDEELRWLMAADDAC